MYYQLQNLKLKNLWIISNNLILFYYNNKIFSLFKQINHKKIIKKN